MELLTQRLRLAPLRDSDLDALLPVLGDRETMTYWSVPFDRAACQAWIAASQHCFDQYGYGRWSIRVLPDERLIGDCGILSWDYQGRLLPDMGYILHHSAWRQGFATEAARAIIGFALHALAMPLIYSHTTHDHLQAQRVIKQLGFRFVESFHDHLNRDVLTFLYRLDRP